MAFSLIIRFLSQVPSILIEEHVLLIRTRFFISYRFIIVVHVVYEPYRLDTFKYNTPITLRKTEEYVVAWGIQLPGIKTEESRPLELCPGARFPA